MHLPPFLHDTDNLYQNWLDQQHWADINNNNNNNIGKGKFGLTEWLVDCSCVHRYDEMAETVSEIPDDIEALVQLQKYYHKASVTGNL